MRGLAVSAVLLATLAGCVSIDDEAHDTALGASTEVGTLGYGQTAVGEYEGDEAVYAFDARAGDRVSVYGRSLPVADVAPQVVLFAKNSDGTAEILAEGERATAPVEMPRAGRFFVASRRPQGASARYRLRLACDGGPCAPSWSSRTDDHCALSDVGQQIADTVASANREKTPVRPSVAVSLRNDVGPVLLSRSPHVTDPRHYPTIFPALGDRIAAARYEVDIRSAYFGVSDPLEELLDGVGRLEARLRRERRNGDPVVVRLIVDGFDNALIGGDKQVGKLARLMHDAFGSLRLDPSLVRVDLLTHAHFSIGEDHSKIIVIDGTHVHIGGANLDKTDNYAAPNHDSAYTLRGEAARAGLVDFDFSWADDNTKVWTCTMRDSRADGCVSKRPAPIVHRPEVLAPEPIGGCLPTIYLGKKGSSSITTNDVDDPIAQGFIGAIRSAKRIVRLASPNLNDDALMKELVAALLRTPSVRVQIVVPPKRNENKNKLPGGGGTNTDARVRMLTMINAAALPLPNERQREILAKFQWRWFPVEGDGPGAFHTKYLSVDDQVAIVGSTNMDTQSINRARESSIAIDDAMTTRRWDETVFLPDFRISKRSDAVFDDGLESP
jgi:phosphatidylserine/phosphatidylglycerophosphate/cardiolipin synthase-like enzyme